MNFFKATDDLFDSLKVVESVADNVITPLSLTPGKAHQADALSCGTVVLISGYFEGYLKSIVQEFVGRLNALKKPLSTLPQSLLIQHLRVGGEILTELAKKDKKAQTVGTSVAFASRLSSVCDPANYELAWEAFAETNSNPGPDVVKAILRGLDAEHSWDEINALVRQHGQLNLFLQSFIGTRNVCAHVGVHSNPPTGVMLIEHCAKFRALAECIDYLMEARFQRYAV